MKPKLLVVSRAFPPFAKSLGGALRVLTMCEYMLRNGVPVQVLAGRGRHYGSFGYDDLLQRIPVTFVYDLAMASSGGGGSQRSGVGGGWKAVAKRIILGSSVPDVGVYAVPALRAAAARLIEAHAITHVLTSGPPHSDHLVGLAAKRRFNSKIKWIVDYRDSWNGTTLFRKDNRFAQALNMAFERKVLAAADVITYVSAPMLAKLGGGSLPSSIASKATMVMNGFDQRTACCTSTWMNDQGRLRVAYFGSIDDRPESYRNPTVLLQTIVDRQLDVQVAFYGPGHISASWQSKLGNRLVVGGVLPQPDAARLMHEQDALVLLHTEYRGADEVVTGKLFEYLLAGRPIISIGPKVMESNRIMESLGRGHFVSHDAPDELAELLLTLALKKKTEGLASYRSDGLELLSRDEQFAKLLRTMTSSLPGAGSR